MGVSGEERKTGNYIVNNLIRKKNFSRESITLGRGSWIDGFLNIAFIDFLEAKLMRNISDLCLSLANAKGRQNCP